MRIVNENPGAMSRLVAEQRNARINALLALLPHYASDDQQRQELLEKIRLERQPSNHA